jgi:hypothetical protein
MEDEMEKLVKEKEQLKPMEVIPLSVIPILGVSTSVSDRSPIRDSTNILGKDN